MKELSVYENTLRRDNHKDPRPIKELLEDESIDSISLDQEFKTELISFMDAESYRRQENNQEIQEILLQKPNTK